MPIISENVSLKKYNTFGVEAFARWYTEINAEEDLAELFKEDRWKRTERLVLGGGSNLLLTKNFDGLVIRINIKGIASEVNAPTTIVATEAGVVWLIDDRRT